VVQLTPQGRPDPAFDHDGVLYLPGPSGTERPVLDAGLLIDELGRIVTIGWQFSYVGTELHNADVVVARFQGRYDRLPPQALEGKFALTGPGLGPGSGQRLLVRFNDDVGPSLQPGDLSVRPVGSSATITPTAVAYDAPTRTAFFSLPAGLADGNYRAVLARQSVSDASGNLIAADFSFDFFVLAGDVNRDRAVNGSDFAILAGSFGKTGMTYDQGDLNGDGGVNGTDFAILAGNFGKAVPAPASVSALVAAPAPQQAIVRRVPSAPVHALASAPRKARRRSATHTRAASCRLQGNGTKQPSTGARRSDSRDG
jgi:hypothetical protein